MEFCDIVPSCAAEFDDQALLPMPFMINEVATWDANNIYSDQSIITNSHDDFLNNIPCSFSAAATSGEDLSSLNFLHPSVSSPPSSSSCSLDDEVDKIFENCVKRKPIDDEDSQEEQQQQQPSKKKQRQELQQEDTEESKDQQKNQQIKRISRRGCATDAQSAYARNRRERINERLKTLQRLVPNGTKVDISTMLEQAIHYVKFMQLQIKLLSSDQHWMYTPIAFNGCLPNIELNAPCNDETNA